MNNLTHYRKHLRINGYPATAASTDDRDVIHTVQAIMKHRFPPLGWRESFVANGGFDESEHDGEE